MYKEINTACITATLMEMLDIYPPHLRPTNVQFNMSEREPILSSNGNVIGEQILVTADINGQSVTKNVQITELGEMNNGYWDPPTWETLWDIEHMYADEADRTRAITALFMWQYIRSYLPEQDATLKQKDIVVSETGQ